MTGAQQIFEKILAANPNASEVEQEVKFIKALYSDEGQALLQQAYESSAEIAIHKPEPPRERPFSQKGPPHLIHKLPHSLK